MNFKDLREELTDESIKNILSQFNVEPVHEDDSSITFPTCCHNLDGGSPKLVYYKNTKLFHCYTECAASFDIFTLLQKMYRLRGKEITLLKGVNLMNYKMNVTIKDPQTQKGMVSCLQFSFTCYFTYHSNSHSNGYFVYIEPVQKQFDTLCIDLRNDLKFNCNKKSEWLEQWAKNYWSGENGSWVVDTLKIEQSE